MDAENSFTILAVRRRTAFVPYDERQESWKMPSDFLCAALASSIGISNIWIFPYMCLIHGGIVFIFAFLVMQILVGVPKVFLDMALGQFTNQGSIACWTFAPLFKGVGIAAIVISLYVILFYFLLLSWVVYYLATTISEDELPWTKCQAPWKTDKCRNLIEICRRSFVLEEDCEPCGYFWNSTDRTCRSKRDNRTVDEFNVSTAVFTENDKLSAHEYFHHYVSDDSSLDMDENENGMKCRILLCFVFCLVLAGCSLRTNIKSMGWAARYATTVPFCFLLVLLANGLGKPGGAEGIRVFLTPSREAFMDPKTWSDAAVHMFFSLSCSTFNLLNLASYNRFQREIFHDAVKMTCVETAYSILAGFVLFSYLGHMTKLQVHDVEKPFTSDSGTSLTFSEFPMAVSLMGGARLWSFLYFSTMLVLGLSAQVFCMKSVIICLQDCFRWMREWELAIIVTLCTICFFGGIPMIFTGGVVFFQVFEINSSYSNTFTIVFFQCIAVAYVYGGKRFVRDIECMIGTAVQPILPWRGWKVWYWLISWYITCPLFAVILLIKYFVHWSTSMTMISGNIGHIFKLIQVTSAIFILGYMVFAISRTPGSCRERLRKLTTASPKWGPAKIADQLLVRQKRKTCADFSMVSSSAASMEGPLSPMPRCRNNVTYSRDCNV